jgi:hypothetical protein
VAMRASARPPSGKGASPGEALRHFCGPGERGVDARVVKLERMSGKRRHTVQQQECVALAAELAEPVEGLGDAGRGLTVYENQHIEPGAGGLLQALLGKRLAPLSVDADDMTALSSHGLGDPVAEGPGDPADDAGPGSDEVGDHRLHSGAARSRDGQRRPVRGPEHVSQQSRCLVHDSARAGSM